MTQDGFRQAVSGNVICPHLTRLKYTTVQTMNAGHGFIKGIKRATSCQIAPEFCPRISSKILSMAQPSLASLLRKREALERKGALRDCWIEYARPGGTAKGNHRYAKLRSRKAFDNECFSRYLSDAEIPEFQRLVENGRALKKIERQIAWLEGHKRKPREAKTSSASDEWYTPLEYIEMAQQVMGGIDLDPASNEVAQQWIRAERYFTEADDGLAQPWHGRIWLNPPYGNQTHLWTEKVMTAHEAGDVTQAIILVRPAAGSAWFQTLSSRYLSCTLHKRIKFINASRQAQASPVHGNVFFYFGDEGEQFRAVFGEIGVVTKPF